MELPNTPLYRGPDCTALAFRPTELRKVCIEGDRGDVLGMLSMGLSGLLLFPPPPELEHVPAELARVITEILDLPEPMRAFYLTMLTGFLFGELGELAPRSP